MAGRLAIFHPPGGLASKGNPFGKDVANLQLFRALARHGGFAQIDFLSLRPVAPEAAREGLLEGAQSAIRISTDSVLNQSVPAAAGALLRGQPDLHELAWLRRGVGVERSYSLLGLVHTIAPPAMRQMIAHSLLAPTHPWDAIVCTSPAVRQALQRMLGEAADYLAERTRGAPPPPPSLPVIPLGVDVGRYAALADRPEVRARLRGELGLADGDVLVLWVGRLSFFEKAFPQPMFRAVQQAARTTGAKVAFVMAGWFPSENDRRLYSEAAAAYAPDVMVRVSDGNNAQQVDELWAACDIFLSLVDNVQETFGLTPLEAMAAGRPVVASDWDGYRFTMRDGVEAFLIPTLIGPAGGLGWRMSLRHQMELESYQSYVGNLAQHTAVHVGRCAEALARLIADPELRRRMGAAGRARVRSAFDWPIVARQVNALVDELAQLRGQAGEIATRHPRNPVKGDPFRDFAGFATQALAPDTPITAPPGVGPDDVRATAAVPLDGAFPAWRASLEECAQALELVASGQANTVRAVLLAFPAERRRAVELGLLWMAKHGLLDWLP